MEFLKDNLTLVSLCFTYLHTYLSEPAEGLKIRGGGLVSNVGGIICLPPLFDIGSTDLHKSGGGARCLPPSQVPPACLWKRVEGENTWLVKAQTMQISTTMM